MAKILLGVTGSVAAIKVEELVSKFISLGHELKIVLTNHATYFVSKEQLSNLCKVENIFSDVDEWPGKTNNQLYQRTDQVLHIELRKWADLLIIAPLDANTLGKIALGLADNCLTSIWRARDISTPVLLAPAMNTMMWQKPATARHLNLIAEENGFLNRDETNPDSTCAIINRSIKNLKVLQPEEKLLACGDFGVGGMASIEKLLAAAHLLLAN